MIRRSSEKPCLHPSVDLRIAYIQKEVAVGFPDVGMTRPGLSRDTHLFNPTWPPRMWFQQLVVIVKARAEASSPGRASKSESELLNLFHSGKLQSFLTFHGMRLPHSLSCCLALLVSSSWKSPPRLQVCARANSSYSPLSLLYSFSYLSLDILLSSLPSSQRNGLVPRVT